MSWKNVGVLTVAATLGLAACENGTEPTAQPLTEAEAGQIASFLMNQSLNATGVSLGLPTTAGQDAEHLPLALAPVGFEEDRSALLQCPAGGTLEIEQTVDGFADDETGAFELNASQVQVYDGCGGQDESGNLSFTLDSAPDVRGSLYVARDESSSSTAAGSITGLLMWTVGDRTGRCRIAFEFDYQSQPGSATFVASGTVCDVALSQNITLTR